MSTHNQVSALNGMFRTFHLRFDNQVGQQSQDLVPENPPIETATSPPRPSLPFLPARRPRLLTPSASREVLITRVQERAQVSSDIPADGNGNVNVNVNANISSNNNGNGPFFANIPAELRNRILTLAFGSRTLHLDLGLSRSRLSVPKTSPRRDSNHVGHNDNVAAHEHCAGAAPLSRSYFPDMSTPVAWRWWSCVCHCLFPPGSQWDGDLKAKRVERYRFPKKDGCLSGEGSLCGLWETEGLEGRGEGCRVGVMGWLRACRQASVARFLPLCLITVLVSETDWLGCLARYVEGINILYSTNTFSIESPVLLDHWFQPQPQAPHLILPERLASTASLELHYDVLLFGDIADETQFALLKQDRARLNSHLQNLSEPFPSLCSLVLSFSNRLYNDASV